MDFEFDGGQELLKQSLNQFLERRYSFADRTDASRSTVGYRPAIWSALADELGLFTLLDDGGPVEQMLVMEAFGRFLVLEPLAETLFQSGWLLRRAAGGAHPLLDSVRAGTARMAVAVTEPGCGHDWQDMAAVAVADGNGWRLSGTKSVVLAAPWADWLLVAARTEGIAGEAGGISLFAVPRDADGLALIPYPTIDGRRAADIALDGVHLGQDALVGTPGAAMPLLEELRDRCLAAQAAEACGVLDRMLADTLAYCRDRKQFGQPIGQFQVLQHRMVDMHIQLELARAAALMATLKLAAPPAERARAASTAKQAIDRACRFIGQNAVQLHGGMGMTDELAVGHYFRRATQIQIEHGTADWHLARLVRLAEQGMGGGEAA